MTRPSIKTPCVADRYADKDRERIAEFDGGLFSVRRQDDGTILASVYSLDSSVKVAVDHAHLAAPYAPPADHHDIITLAVMIAKRDARQRDLLERAGWASSADMREQMERHAARLGDDLCELATRMNRLCRGDKTALDLAGPAWPDAPKTQAQACCDEAEKGGAQPRFGEG